MTKQSSTNRIVLTALVMCVTMIATMFIRVPIPFTQGYAHLGDAMIFFGVLLLGWKYGAIAAGVGSALGDIIGGFAIWAPWTLLIKGLMALIMGIVVANSKKISTISIVLGMILGGIVMVAGYYFAESVLYGNWVAPIAGVPWNIGQFVVGIVISVALYFALSKTPAKNQFTYTLNSSASSTHAE